MTRLGSGYTIVNGKVVKRQRRADVCTEIKKRAKAKRPKLVSRAKAQSTHVHSKRDP